MITTERTNEQPGDPSASLLLTREKEVVCNNGWCTCLKEEAAFELASVHQVVHLLGLPHLPHHHLIGRQICYSCMSLSLEENGCIVEEGIFYP